MSKIELDGVTKRFGETIAVDDIDLEIREGEFFSLLGPSGCGKTTTLRMISGFERPSEGQIHIDGTLSNDVPPENRPTNIVFQDLALFTHMNVFENIAYGLKLDGVSRDEMEAQVDRSLELVDLPGFQDRAVTELSGGQQQRVALARALANTSPTDIVLFDEPLSSLDRELRQEMQMELRNIQDETGLTFLYVTHDQEVAMTMSDRLAIMRDGEVEQVGSPSEVYNEPRNRFVANFIGDMISFEGRVTDHTFVPNSHDGQRFDLPAGYNVNNDHEAYLAIRPERCEIAVDESMLASSNVLQAVVEDVVFRGSMTSYTLQCGDERIDVEVQNSRNDSIYEQGETVYVGLDAEDFILYPAETA